MEQDAWKKFEEGKSFDAYLTYGAHPLEEEEGYRFCVYAPRARKVELIGEFNDWKGQPMEYERGNWKTVSKEALPGMLYKYRIYQEDGRVLDKADPFAFSTELRPGTASRLTETIWYSYKDEDWMASRGLKGTRASLPQAAQTAVNISRSGFAAFLRASRQALHLWGSFTNPLEA